MHWQDKQQNCDALAKMKFDCFISPSTLFLDIEVDITVLFLVSCTNVTGDLPVRYWPKRHLHDGVINFYYYYQNPFRFSFHI